MQDKKDEILGVQTPKVSTADIPVHLYYLRRDVKEIKAKLEKDYITKQEFDPVKKIVFGLVSLILLTVMGAFLSLIIK